MRLRPAIYALIILSLSIFASGCAIGTTHVKVKHAPVDRLDKKHSANIYLKQFEDRRKDTMFIGNKRNGFGKVLGHIAPPVGVSLTDLVTRSVAESLEAAGYTVTVQETPSAPEPSGARFDAVVDGQINEFWLDLYMKVWHNVTLNMQARRTYSERVIWEREVKGSQSNVLVWGATSEFEKVISQAFTEALNNAAREFSSEEFYRAVKY